jgi:hypothetical protein
MPSIGETMSDDSFAMGTGTATWQTEGPDSARLSNMSAATWGADSPASARLSNMSAATWQAGGSHSARLSDKAASEYVLSLTKKAERKSITRSFAFVPRLLRRAEGITVFVNIYDVSKERRISKINKWLASRYSPLKFGGLFHAGVEIDGVEWSYGQTPDGSKLSGVASVEPRMHPAHNYRQTLRLRRTRLTKEEIAIVLAKMREEYLGEEYCLLRRNCCHFAHDFCRRLGAGGLPRWVRRLAKLGSQVDSILQKAGV